MASNSPSRNPRIPGLESASTLSMSPEFSPVPFESPNILSSSILSKQTTQFDLSPIFIGSKPSFRLQERISGALTSRDTLDLLEKVRRILTLNHRSREDARILYEFLDNTKFFRDFRENNTAKLHENDALKYICRHMKYERAVAGKVVSDKGNTDGKTYIILSGEVCRINNNKESPVTNIKKGRNRANTKLNVKASDQIEINNDIRKKSVPKDTSFEDSSYRVSRMDSVLQKSIISQDYSMETSTKLPGMSFERSMIRDKTPEPVNFFLRQHTQGRISPEKNENNILKGQLKFVKMAQPVATQQVKNPPLVSRASIVIKPCEVSELTQSNTTAESFPRKSERFGTILNRLYKEDYFGGLGSDSSLQQETLVVGTECELLIIDEKVFAHVRKRFERRNAKKMNFFMDFFPGVEPFAHKKPIYSKLAELKEIPFDVNTYITVQGTPSTACYMLFEGVCDLYMKIPEDQAYNDLINDYGEQRDHNKQDGILVCKLSKGMFIGEEFFFNEDKQYEFTVRAASPDVSVIVMDTSVLNTEVSSEFLKALKHMYLNKRQNHFTSASKRLKVKSAVISLMNLSRKKSKHSARGESPEKEDRSASPEFYKYASRSPSKEPCSPEIDNSTKVTNRVLQPLHRLPSPIAPTLKLKLTCAAKSKVRQMRAERNEKNEKTEKTEKEDQDLLYSFTKLVSQENRGSPRLKRVVEKAIEANNMTKEKEKEKEKNVQKEKEKSSSVEKIAVPMLNLEKLDDYKVKQKSIKQLLRRMKKSQSRAIRLNRDNISISIATDRSSSKASILPDDTGKSINSDRGAKLNVFFSDKKEKAKLVQQTSGTTETTKATLMTERSIFNSMVERITTSGSSGKIKKNFVIHQKSKTLVDEQESYGLKPFWPQVAENKNCLL